MPVTLALPPYRQTLGLGLRPLGLGRLSVFADTMTSYLSWAGLDCLSWDGTDYLVWE